MRFFQMLRGSQFFRQVIILSSGTALAQLVALAFLPVLTRLYSPQDFGILALFMAIASPLLILGTAGLRELIVLPRNNKVAAQLVRLIFLISLIISVIVLFVVWIFETSLIKMSGRNEIVYLLYLLPLSILFYANAQALRYWSMRRQGFSDVSKGQVVKTAGNLFVAISIKLAGYAQQVGFGLVVAYVFSELINMLFLAFKNMRDNSMLLKPLRKKQLYVTIIRYRKMASSLTLSQIISTLYTQLPNFIIGSFFGLGALGLFNIAERIAAAPALLIANAVGDVYRQKAATQFREIGRFDRLMIKTMVGVTAIAILPYVIGIIFAPEIFSALLGLQWQQAGVYASTILVGSFFGFVTTPVDKAPMIVGAHKFIFGINLFRLALHVLAAAGVMFRALDLMDYIRVLVLIRIIIYTLMTIRSWRYAQGNCD